MKELLCVIIVLFIVLCLCACGQKGSAYAAKEADIEHLDAAYADRTLYFGDAHVHANTGGNSDGQSDLPTWTAALENLNMDFATIVDHRQVSHMYLDQWDDACFIGGSEAGTTILDSPAQKANMHYNMLFSDPEAFKTVLRKNAGFGYQEDTTFFSYPKFTVTQMKELIADIQEAGGMFVHVHPKCPGYMTSDNPAAYWFADNTGLEVFYGEQGPSVDSSVTKLNYRLWVDLLHLGTRVWATAGSDSHNSPNTRALTAVYAEEKTPDSIFSHMRVGDFTPGYAGIRMAVGETKMGGVGAFAGNRVVFSVGGFHESILEKGTAFEVVLLTDKGEVFREKIDHTKETYFALDADASAAFYRVEVQDMEGNFIALGNPIWNG